MMYVPYAGFLVSRASPVKGASAAMGETSLAGFAFLPANTGFGLHQPGRYAAFLFTRIHNFWV